MEPNSAPSTLTSAWSNPRGPAANAILHDTRRAGETRRGRGDQRPRPRARDFGGVLDLGTTPPRNKRLPWAIKGTTFHLSNPWETALIRAERPCCGVVVGYVLGHHRAETDLDVGLRGGGTGFCSGK